MEEKSYVSKEEQETDIVIDAETKTANVYSCVPSTIKKLKELSNHPDVKCVKEDNCSIMMDVPQNWIKISPPRKVEYTEEQKEALRERLSKARNARSQNE